LVGWLVDWLLSQLVIKLRFLPQSHVHKILFHSTGEAVNIFREVISVYFENDMIRINALYGKNAKNVNITLRGAYSYHGVLMG
jgi:hypothetical protein